MDFRNVLVIAGVSGALLLACGHSDLSGLCDKAEECARKAGKPFSKSECQADAKAEREKADTSGCSEPYQEMVDCVMDLDIQCGDDLNKKGAAECGSKFKALAKCME